MRRICGPSNHAADLQKSADDRFHKLCFFFADAVKFGLDKQSVFRCRQILQRIEELDF